MSELITLVQANWQIAAAAGIGLIVLLMLLTLLILQIRLLRRVKRVQRKVDAVTERVGNYLSVILDSELESETAEGNSQTIALQEKMQREEEESRIISAVLQEIFP